jgi:hypothetical protein
MRKVLYWFLILVLASCTQKKSKEPCSFKMIDMSYDNGWTATTSVKVSNNGNLYKFIEGLHNVKRYYRFEIDQKEIDSISTLVKIIFNTKLDTVYNRRCWDCGAYNLIIKANDKKFKCYVEDLNNPKKETKCMRNLVSYIMKITYVEHDTEDSIFNFESRTIRFQPLPTFKNIKFTPPASK